jgi:hypothetical protein
MPLKSSLCHATSFGRIIWIEKRLGPGVHKSQLSGALSS